MVGGRVLTKDYVREEIARIDLADLLARAAERVSRADLEAATRDRGALARRAADAGRRRRAARRAPVAPSCTRRWRRCWPRRCASPDGRAGISGSSTARSRALAEALERPEFRHAVGEVIDDLLARYRERMGVYPRFWMGVATTAGRDRPRPPRGRAPRRACARSRGIAITRCARRAPTCSPTSSGGWSTIPRWPRGSRRPSASCWRRRRWRRCWTRPRRRSRARCSPTSAGERSELTAWMAERLERARRALVADGSLRAEIDGWVKTRLTELIERHHGRIAEFIENGVLALGPDGAVRLIEEHAGDDLQYIRVNGTVVGGLAGGRHLRDPSDARAADALRRWPDARRPFACYTRASAARSPEVSDASAPVGFALAALGAGRSPSALGRPRRRTGQRRAGGRNRAASST